LEGHAYDAVKRRFARLLAKLHGRHAHRLRTPVLFRQAWAVTRRRDYSVLRWPDLRLRHYGLTTKDAVPKAPAAEAASAAVAVEQRMDERRRAGGTRNVSCAGLPWCRFTIRIRSCAHGVTAASGPLLFLRRGLEDGVAQIAQRQRRELDHVL